MDVSDAEASLQEPLALLERGAKELGLSLAAPLMGQFAIYLAELQRWNRRINLTGLKTHRDIVLRHFLDSLAVVPFLKEARTLADIGSGAGFPGLVLKLVRPALAVTLVESRGKKAAFLEYLVTCLKVTETVVAPVHLTPKLAAAWGPTFDLVLSRAALPLADLIAVAAPLLKPGGRVLALKGPNLREKEFAQAQARAGRLGLAPLQVCRYRLPVTGEPRLAVQGTGPPG